MKPRYYSEEKERIEELKRRIGEDAAEEEGRAERIRDAYARRRTRKKPNKVLSSSRVLIYALLVLLLIMLISNTRFLLF